MHIPGASSPQAEINITPLVDVVLVLLIIFMVVTPLDERWLEVHVPQTSGAPAGPPTNAAPVVVLDGSQLTVDGKTTEPGRLADTLRERYAHWRGTEQKLALFEASGAVPYGRVIAAMDEAKQGGAEALGWISREPAPH